MTTPLTFLNVLQEAFVNEFQDMTFGQTLFAMAISVLCAAFICFVYAKTFHGALFSRSFCSSLFAMQITTTLLVLAVSTNIYLALGTLGAISIVRFRSAVKEPMDIAFMFLAICSGIICGANLLGIAIFGTLFIGGILFVIGKIPKASCMYILVVCADASHEEEIVKLIESGARSMKLKSKSLLGSTTELTYELVLKKETDHQFINQITSIETVTHVNLIKSNGEFV